MTLAVAKDSESRFAGYIEGLVGVIGHGRGPSAIARTYTRNRAPVTRPGVCDTARASL
jgi:hypothetical protein